MIKMKTTAYNPDYVSPPGETIQETLEMLGLSQAELAERTGRPKKTINEIILGKASITPETALQLELVLQIPSAFWLSREAKYRAFLARQEENNRIALDTDFLKNLPLKEMINRGWIISRENKLEQAREVLRFFGVVSSDKIPRASGIAFRHSKSFASNPWALAAWLRKGELDAQNIRCKEYNQDTFLNILQKIRSLTIEKPKTFVPDLTKLCASAGVAVVFVQELPKTSVSGATKWLSHNRPLIQISLRHKRDDMMWFSFFHEAGHVYLGHAKREVLLDDNFDDPYDQHETDANKFAMEFLIPQLELNRFLQQNDMTEKSIVQFAKKSLIAPSIIVGRLQHEGKIAYDSFNKLKITFSWDDWPIVETE
jgi:HTH-type transcriptional regulator / antitoxin HigA